MIECPNCERGIANVYEGGIVGYIGVPCACGYFNAEMKYAGERSVQSTKIVPQILYKR